MNELYCDADTCSSHPYLWDGKRRYEFLAAVGCLEEIEHR